MIALPTDDPSGTTALQAVSAQLPAGIAETNLYPQGATLPIQPGVAYAELPSPQLTYRIAMSQPMGWWQQQRGSQQIIAPMPALSSRSVLPHSDHGQPYQQQHSQSFQNMNPTVSGALNPFSALDNDSASQSRYSSLGLSPQDEFEGVLRTDRGANISDSGLRNLARQPENISLPRAGNHIASAQLLGTHSGQANFIQERASTQQCFMEPSDRTSQWAPTLPNFLPSLFEPTPFPQLPAFPPHADQQNQRAASEQQSTTSHQLSIVRPLNPPQNLQPHSSATGYLSFSHSRSPIERSDAYQSHQRLEGEGKDHGSPSHLEIQYIRNAGGQSESYEG
jgi:hypothetical protein